MAISHAIIAAIVAVYGDKFDTHKSAGNAAVFFVSRMIPTDNRARANVSFQIYWISANFACTWGPLAWVVSSEVFPLDMRGKGMSVSSGANWIVRLLQYVATVNLANHHYR